MFKNIVFHWSAGNYYPCEYDKLHYHFLFDKEGKEYKGKYSPEDNLNCKDNKYAAHVRNGNTGRIGLAVCCKKDDNYPPTQKQIEAMCKKAAQLCTFYGINPSMCITHAEFDPSRKIDITEIPYKNLYGIQKCGDYLRELTIKYYNKENEVR